jgi:hypothetical protein
MIQHIKTTTLSLAISVLASSAGAINQIPMPPVVVEPDPSTRLEAQVCVGCEPQEGQGSISLLQPIFYFRDPKSIKTIPRTREAAGDLAAIGKLQNRGGLATAFLVSPCHVLTSYHVAFSSDPRHPSRSNVSQFYYGQGHDDSFESHVNAMPVAWGNWQGSMEEGTPKDDWALLRLDKCVGQQQSYFDLVGYSDNTLIRIMKMNGNIAGILKRDYSHGLNVDSNCQIEGNQLLDDNSFDRTTIEHRCASLHGSSGAPLYTTLFGFPQVFAINSAATRGGDDEERVEKDLRKRHGATSIESIARPLAQAMMAPEEVKYIADQTGEQNWRPNARYSKPISASK